MTLERRDTSPPMEPILTELWTRTLYLETVTGYPTRYAAQIIKTTRCIPSRNFDTCGRKVHIKDSTTRSRHPQTADPSTRAEMRQDHDHEPAGWYRSASEGVGRWDWCVWCASVVSIPIPRIFRPWRASHTETFSFWCSLLFFFFGLTGWPWTGMAACEPTVVR